MDDAARLADTKRELDTAVSALAACGLAERPNLECRVAALQDRFLTQRATSLDELAVRLGSIRALVASLGEAGLLLNLVDATLADVENLKGIGVNRSTSHPMRADHSPIRE